MRSTRAFGLAILNIIKLSICFNNTQWIGEVILDGGSQVTR
jgi:hypothetical protein